MSHAGDGLAEKGKSQLGRVQAARPAADSGGIGQPISVLDVRQSLFPRAVFRKAQPQRLAARHQTVMRVRKREHRKKSEGRPTIGAAAAMDPNPVMMLVVGLLAAAAVTNDGISFTNRTVTENVFVAVYRPVGFKLLRRGGNWDKEDRNLKGVPLRR